MHTTETGKLRPGGLFCPPDTTVSFQALKEASLPRSMHAHECIRVRVCMRACVFESVYVKK